MEALRTIGYRLLGLCIYRLLLGKDVVFSVALTGAAGVCTGKGYFLKKIG